MYKALQELINETNKLPQDFTAPLLMWTKNAITHTVHSLIDAEQTLLLFSLDLTTLRAVALQKTVGNKYCLNLENCSSINIRELTERYGQDKEVLTARHKRYTILYAYEQATL